MDRPLHPQCSNSLLLPVQLFRDVRMCNGSDKSAAAVNSVLFSKATCTLSKWVRWRRPPPAGWYEVEITVAIEVHQAQIHKKGCAAQKALLEPAPWRWWLVQLKLWEQWGAVPEWEQEDKAALESLVALAALVDADIPYVLGCLAYTDGVSLPRSELKWAFDVSGLDSSLLFQLPSSSPQQSLCRHQNCGHRVTANSLICSLC